LAEAIEATTGLAADIKWPNDLHVARRKLAGILAEGVTGSGGRTVTAVVLGYGINVGRMSYPPELANRATSLETELGRSIDRAALCAGTLVAIARRFADLVDGRFDAILDAWRKRAPASRGAPVTWQASTGSLRSGTTAGIDERGALLVQSGAGIERIVSGEVQWV
jgi:BirA family biotin operon repressor/biotin-[acetyl-CoA-carboxylase] ligase